MLWLWRDSVDVKHTSLIDKMTKTGISLFLVLCMLNAFTAIKAQTADTLSVGMELRLQNTIALTYQMYDISSDGFKGVPTDTASFRLYRQSEFVCM